MKELTIDAKVENIEKVTAFVDEQMESLRCPVRAFSEKISLTNEGDSSRMIFNEKSAGNDCCIKRSLAMKRIVIGRKFHREGIISCEIPGRSPGEPALEPLHESAA